MNVNLHNPLLEDETNGVRAEYFPVLDDKRVEIFALKPLQDPGEPSVTIHLTRNHRSQNRDLPDTSVTLKPDEIDSFIEALRRAKEFVER